MLESHDIQEIKQIIRLLQQDIARERNPDKQQELATQLRLNIELMSVLEDAS